MSGSASGKCVWKKARAAETPPPSLAPAPARARASASSASITRYGTNSVHVKLRSGLGSAIIMKAWRGQMCSACGCAMAQSPVAAAGGMVSSLYAWSMYDREKSMRL